MDEALRIWLHDYSSTHGTAVGQNSQNQTEFRKKETWILAYAPGTPDEFEERRFAAAASRSGLSFPTT